MGAYSKRPSKGGRRESRPRAAQQKQPAQADRQSIREWLSCVRFQKVFFGGVRESDVWKKIAELNAMYEQELAAERVRYDTLLEERARLLAEQMYAQRAAGNAEWEKAGDGEYE